MSDDFLSSAFYTAPPAPQEIEWRSPVITEDPNKFVESYNILRQKGATDAQAQDELARYIASVVDNMDDDTFNDVYKDTNSREVLKMYLDLRDPGFAGAALEGMARGAVSAAPAAGVGYAGMRAGAATGRKIGSAIGMIPHPAAKAAAAAAPFVGGALGALSGIIGGTVAGQVAEKQIFPEQGIVPELNPFMEAGRTTGAAIAAIPGATAAMRMVSPTFGQLFQNVAGIRHITKGLQTSGEMARQSPRAYSLGQVLGAVGAGGAVTVSEFVDPGDALSRAVAETTGSLLMPSRLLSGVVAEGVSTGKTGLRFLKSSQEQAVVNSLLRSLDEFQEDPAMIVAKLSGRSPIINPETGQTVTLPPELIAESLGISALANAASRKSPGMDARRQQAFDDSIKAWSAQLRLLHSQGTPESLMEAARLRQKGVESFLAGVIVNPLQRLLQSQQQALAKLPRGVPPGQVEREFGEKVKGLVAGALEDWRSAERLAYKRANLENVEGVATNIVSTWNRLKREKMLEGEEKQFPEIFRNFISSAAGETPRLEADRLLSQARSRTEQQDRAVRSVFMKYPAGQERLSVEDAAEQWLVGHISETKDGSNLLKRIGGQPVNVKELSNLSDEDVRSLRNYYQDALGRLRDPLEVDPVRNEVIYPTGYPKENLSETKRLLEVYGERLTTELDVRRLKKQAESVPLDLSITSLGEIQKFRSRLLMEARSAAAKPNFQEESIYNDLADAALRDLGVHEDVINNLAKQGQALKPEQEAFLNALQISRSGNDLFRRTFGSDVLKRTPEGGEALLPEFLASKFLSAADNVSYQRAVDLQSVVNLAPPLTRAPSRSAKRLATFNNALDVLFRNVASSNLVDRDVVINPVTGQTKTMRLFDERGLQKFLDENEQILSLPAMRSLKNDLKNVDSANRVLSTAQSKTGMVAQQAEDEAWFSRYLAGQSPTLAFSKAMGDKNFPEREFRRLLNVLAGNKPDPNDLDRWRTAIRDTVMDVAQQGATRNDGTLDLARFRNTLFSPFGKNQQSPMDILSEPKYGVVDNRFKTQLFTLLNHLENTETFMRARRVMGSEGFQESLPEQFLIRYTGAQIGGQMSGGAPALQTAAMGSQVLRKYLEHIPTGNAGKLLARALEPTPESQDLLQRFLEKGAAQRAGVSAGQAPRGSFERVLVRLIGAPIILLPAAQTGIEEVSPPPLRQAPLVPRSVPTSVAPPVQSSPPPVPAAPLEQRGSVTSPEDRQRFAALFPGDIVSPMIRQTIL